MKRLHDDLDQANFDYSHEFKKYLTDSNLRVEYLDTKNKPVFDNHTYSYAMNIFIQRATQITSWNRDRFKGSIRLMSRFEPPAGYMPT